MYSSLSVADFRNCVFFRELEFVSRVFMKSASSSLVGNFQFSSWVVQKLDLLSRNSE